MKKIYSQELVDQMNLLSNVTNKTCTIKQATPANNVSFWSASTPAPSEDGEHAVATANAKVATLGAYPFKTQVMNGSEELINEAITNATHHIVGSIVCGIKEMEDYHTVGVGFNPEVDVDYNPESRELTVTAYIGYTGLVKD